MLLAIAIGFLFVWILYWFVIYSDNNHLSLEYRNIDYLAQDHNGKPKNVVFLDDDIEKWHQDLKRIHYESGKYDPGESWKTVITSIKKYPKFQRSNFGTQNNLKCWHCKHYTSELYNGTCFDCKWSAIMSKDITYI